MSQSTAMDEIHPLIQARTFVEKTLRLCVRSLDLLSAEGRKPSCAPPPRSR